MKSASFTAVRRWTVPGLALGFALSGAALLAPAIAAPPQEFGAALVAESPATGAVGFVGTEPGEALASGARKGASPVEAAKTFVAARGASFGLRAPGTTLAVDSALPGVADGDVVRLRQEIDGVPVMGGQFAVSLDSRGRVLSVMGEATPETDVDTTASVARGAAVDTAIAYIAKHQDLDAATLRSEGVKLQVFDPRLVGIPGALPGARPAWVVEVRGAPHVGHEVVVDAQVGVVAHSFDLVHAAKNRSVCDANNTATQLPCTTPVWTEGNTPANSDNDVVKAYEYAGDTYDFYMDRFGWDSLDGAGMALKSTVDYCQTGKACPYANAFWNGSQMGYGDGYASADDVVGHELTHGFLDHTSRLFYWAQSGAINESMADVFGEFVDQVNGGSTDTAGNKWLMGEDLPIGALRSMKDPGVYGDPDSMLSSDYHVGPEDNEGVHWNSGVGNKAAFLITDGGEFNGQTVRGLGLRKAARLYFTVNHSLLVSGSDYADLANALGQACKNLVAGAVDGFVASDCAEVAKVVTATEMDQVLPAAATHEASVCPTGTQVLATAWSDDLESVSGQFVQDVLIGATKWYYPQNTHSYGAGWDPTWTTSGETNLWGDADDKRGDAALRMSKPVTVPEDGYFHFNHAFLFEYESDGAAIKAFDGGVLEYSTTGDAGPWADAGTRMVAPGGDGGYTATISTEFSNPLAGRAGFGGLSHGYGSTRVDLTDLAGKSVMFRWRIGTDGEIGDYGWFIDDPRIVRCGVPVDPPVVIKDTVAPNTVLMKKPAKRTTKRRAVFTYRSTEAGSIFYCKVDKQAWKKCGTSRTLKKLKKGKHTFRVYAVDKAGNKDRTPATWTWRVKAKRR